jgi:hypothetical protein
MNISVIGTVRGNTFCRKNTIIAPGKIPRKTVSAYAVPLLITNLISIARYLIMAYEMSTNHAPIKKEPGGNISTPYLGKKSIAPEKTKAKANSMNLL